MCTSHLSIANKAVLSCEGLFRRIQLFAVIGRMAQCVLIQPSFSSQIFIHVILFVFLADKDTIWFWRRTRLDFSIILKAEQSFCFKIYPSVHHLFKMLSAASKSIF